MQMPKHCLDHYECERFLSLPGERIVVAKREHWLVTILPLTAITISIFTLSLLVFAIFFKLFFQPILGTLTIIVLWLIGLSAIIKIMADWYYHYYVITTRKLIEVRCAPLFSHIVNDVLLDQVRITEVDAQIKGFFNEIFDIGNVVIDFDRPSHEEKMIIRNIQDPAQTGMVLAHTFELMMQYAPVWFNRKMTRDIYKFTDDMGPNVSIVK